MNINTDYSHYTLNNISYNNKNSHKTLSKFSKKSIIQPIPEDTARIKSSKNNSHIIDNVKNNDGDNNTKNASKTKSKSTQKTEDSNINEAHENLNFKGNQNNKISNFQSLSSFKEDEELKKRKKISTRIEKRSSKITWNEKTVDICEFRYKSSKRTSKRNLSDKDKLSKINYGNEIASNASSKNIFEIAVDNNQNGYKDNNNNKSQF